MKNKLFKALERLYPNATSFTVYFTAYNNESYCVAETKDGEVDITDAFRSVWTYICCSALQKRLS